MVLVKPELRNSVNTSVRVCCEVGRRGRCTMSDETGKVVGVIGMKSDPRCRICQLAKWNMILFVRAHEMRLMQGKPVAQVCKMINEAIVEWNLDPKHTIKHEPLTDTSASNHFAKHVPDMATANAKLMANLSPEAKQNAFLGALTLATADNVDDFQKFHSIAQALHARFEQLNKQLATDKELDPKTVGELRMMAESTGRMLESAIKMRNQEKLMAQALDSCLQTYTMGSLEALLKGTDKLVMELKPYLMKQGIADEFVGKFRELISSSLTENAKVAIESVRQQYKMA